MALGSFVRQGLAEEEAQYEVLRRIGSGAFAEVFLVAHVADERQCVMKEITSFTTMEPDKKQATELEVQLLRALNHPNIVAYQDSFVNKDGHLCIFMEYCEHGDVHTLLQGAKRAGKSLPGENQVLEWFIQLSLALQVLHSKRILHRDLKTQNIFLSGCGTTSDPSDFAVKLGDLGVAKVLGHTAELAMTQIGTPFYMSPELFNSKPYGHKSDIWGLGCVLYELINGHTAFEAQNLNALAMKILRGRHTPITSSCSEEVKGLIQSMLSTNPAHRPALQEMLHVPAVRRRLPAAVQAAVSAVVASGAPNAKPRAEAVLAQQLSSLGLHGIRFSSVGPEHFSAEITIIPPQRRDKRQIQQKLERAERRQKREEVTLRRLQETAAMLGIYINDPPSTEAPLTSKPPLPMRGGYGGPPPALPLCLVPQEQLDGDSPALSHRDKILLRKERRREEEQQRFEEEARKIREENLAFQRAWVMGSKDGTSSNWQSMHAAPSAQLTSQQTSKHLPANLSPLQPLLDYKHITPDNLANPFQSCRQKVVHTPAKNERERIPSSCSDTSITSAQPRRLRTAEHPRAPAVHYSEPPPPHGAPCVKRGSRPSCDAKSIRRTRSLRGVTLEAITRQPFQSEHHPDDPDDSDFSASCSDGSDIGGRAGSDDDARLRLESQVVQQRIDGCHAAIYRHKMTIDMLQGVSMDQGAEAFDAGSDAFLARSRPSEAARPRGAVPALVQDRIARLRRRCIEGLGDVRFEDAKRCLQMLKEEGADIARARARMISLLGLEAIGFYALLDQIVHMEKLEIPVVGRDDFASQAGSAVHWRSDRHAPEEIY
ncbi:unnamed protein product [Polarella glacialis]|uniref:non-specific serine/threonine protein kinase n=1 Tax=Polarella glacialis TaxID=89957 RepID=A0A813LE74_POLGL|nr:unnamed protein product [Polarella glacialis]